MGSSSEVEGRGGACHRGAAKYPRSEIAASRAPACHTGYGAMSARHATEYAPWANANIIVACDRSLEGLEHVEAIAAVEAST